MTQFDIGGGFPSGRESKGGVVARPSQGVSESLQAPGLSVQPAVSPAANLVGQLLTALGQAGSTANDYSQYKARERHMAKEEDALQQGLASQNGSADLPVIVNDIDNGKLKIPEGLKGDQITAWTRDYIGSRVHKDMPQAYRDHYVSMLTPSVERALLNKQDDEKKIAIANNKGLLESRVASQNSVEEIKSSLDAFRSIKPDATDDEVYSIVLPAAHAAALGGDAERLNMLNGVLGDRFPDKQQALVATLRQSQANQERANRESAQDYIAQAYNDGLPSSEIRSRIKSSRDALGEQGTDAELRTLQAREHQAATEARTLLSAAELQSYKSQLSAQDDSVMAAAFSTGGASRLKDEKFTDSSGHDHPFPRNERVQEATERGMARIASENANDLNATLAKQVEFLSRNGVTYEPWTRTMNAGAMVTPADIAGVGENGKQAMPANVTAGYEMHKRLGAMSGEVRNAHENQTAGKLYELAELSEKYATPGDPAKSLIMAMKSMASEKSGATAIPTKRVQESAKSLADGTTLWWGKDAANSSELAGKVERLATLYVSAIGMDPKAAVDEATKKIGESHKVINGWAVDTGNRLVPPQFGDIGSGIAKDYAAKHPEEGKAGDYTLIPGETDSSWILFNMKSKWPVDNWRTEGFFTNSDLSKRWESLDTKARDEIVSKIVANNATTLNRKYAIGLRDTMTGMALHSAMHRDFIVPPKGASPQ